MQPQPRPPSAPKPVVSWAAQFARRSLSEKEAPRLDLEDLDVDDEDWSAPPYVGTAATPLNHAGAEGSAATPSNQTHAGAELEAAELAHAAEPRQESHRCVFSPLLLLLGDVLQSKQSAKY
jgi:hypothetical protein